MYIIVDSGSTKSDWVILSNKEQKYYSTMGFNPYFHKSETIVNAIKQAHGIYEIRDEVSMIYYYGAGCSSPELNLIIEKALKEVFKQAIIVVDHDLMACALATYNNKPAISCIIGTGSNSCYFDGEKIYEEVPALGYILGDEGSGTYFGKQLLSNFLYHQLPKNIEEDLIKEYQLTKSVIIDNVYMKADANVYIASFMKFIVKHDHDPYIKQMVYDGFKKFMEIHVCCYPNFKEVETHFIGSIAHLFKNELERAANKLGVSIGKVVRKPIEGLIHYHKTHILTK